MDRTIGWLWFLFHVLLIIFKILLFMLRFFNGFDHEKPPFLAMMFAALGLVVMPIQTFRGSVMNYGKEIAAISVYDCGALTSPWISGFNPLMKVPNNCFPDQSLVYLDSLSNLSPSQVLLSPGGSLCSLNFRLVEISSGSVVDPN
ncbi:hypothetical protein B296_00004648 [Ensete ventricosum]|uniref:Uncharacterized protein n=1 Tax=Ensete ventricosum TaxID=4639 RepID=A0A427B7K5_ENSVE|nr:hypothetical protein B296_00004648 [Ensete ventricosum]